MLAWQASLRAGRRGARRRGIGRRGLGRRGARRGGPRGGRGGTWVGVASTTGERMDMASCRKIPTSCELTEKSSAKTQVPKYANKLPEATAVAAAALTIHTRPLKFGEEQRTRSFVGSL
eukprot:scaffold17597_cov61-Phaeocystis_antarctica.AAC.3